MSQIKKTSLKMNLDGHSVYINDTDPTSRYFSVKNIPDALISGKNYFLISGTPLLQPGTPVVVEVLDINDNPIYSEVSNVLIDGIYRLINIIAYPDTPAGPATITILGKAIDVPTRWQGRYNVRWKITIPVNPMTGDTNHPIFTYTPKLYVDEIYDANQSLDLINQSYFITGSGLSGTALGNISRDAPYYLVSNTSSFTSNMAGGIINVPNPVSTIYSANYITQIVQVINCSTVQVSPSYLYSQNYTDKTIDANSLAFKPINFSPSAYSLKYTVRMQNTGSINKRISYLKVHAVDVDTIVGTLKYINLYKQPGNISIGKYPVQPNEMIESGSHFGNLLDFTNNWTIPGQNQWHVECVTDINSSSLYVPGPTQYNSAKALFGIKTSSLSSSMTGYMNDLGYIYPSGSSLTLYLTSSASNPSYLFFGGIDSDYYNVITWYKTYVYCPSASVQSMSLSSEEGVSIFVNGVGQFSQSYSAFSNPCTMSFSSGLNEIDMFLQNQSGSAYVSFGGISFSTASFVGGLNAINVPAVINYNSCKLIDSINFSNQITGSLIF